MIVYYKFYDYIRKHNIKIKDIINNTGISSATASNLRNNKSITVETISKICKYLDCQPGEIMEYVKDKGDYYE